MILDHSFPRETDYVKKNNIPLVIVGGTVEYHGAHCSYGCDTLVAEGLIKKLAEEPCVIVGRCADYILRDRTNCINVFIHADLEYRTERAIRLHNLPEAKGEAIVRKTDKTRANYYQFYTENKWGVASNYNLSLNSAKLSKEKIVDIITHYVEVFQAE